MNNIKTITQNFITGIILLSVITFQTYAQNPIKIKPSETRHGPENGALVIIGGGGLTPEIRDKIIELAGGKDYARFVVVTNASGDGLNTRSGTARWLSELLGENNVRILDLKTIHEANKEENLEAVKQATGIFFDGGRQWRIADAYLNTLVHQEFQNVLARGGVIAGSSAGASIQGSFLWRGDTKTPDILVGDHTQGLAFLKNSVIDQHILARNRQFDLIEFVKGAPQLIGLGLDESTAVVVIKDELEVVGKSIVAIHSYPNIIGDTETVANINASPTVNTGTLPPANPAAIPVTNPPDVPAGGEFRGPRVHYSNGSADAYKPFIVLRSGQKYDLKERKVIPSPRREFQRGGLGPGAGNPAEPAANPTAANRVDTPPVTTTTPPDVPANTPPRREFQRGGGRGARNPAANPTTENPENVPVTTPKSPEQTEPITEPENKQENNSENHSEIKQSEEKPEEVTV